jgi:hypothetical protein
LRLRTSAPQPMKRSRLAKCRTAEDHARQAITCPFADTKYFKCSPTGGRKHTVYIKIDFVATNKAKILQLARSKTKFDGYHTKTNPKTRASGTRVVIHVPFKIRAPRFIHIDDVGQFSKVKALKCIPDKLDPARLPEDRFKAGILHLLRETKTPKDWAAKRMTSSQQN